MSADDPLGWREFGQLGRLSRIGYGTITRQLHTTDIHSVTKDTPTMPNLHATTSSLRARLDKLTREVERLASRLDAYGEDVFEVGSILTWDNQFTSGATRYSYAAIKTPNGWYVAGRTPNAALSWDQLIDGIVDDAAELPTIYVVTDLEAHDPTA